MPSVRVYYDYFEDNLVPLWLFVYFGRGRIEWNRKCVYLPIEAPFNRIYPEDINDDILSLSIQLEDLTVNMNRPGFYGINLENLITRMKMHKDYRNIDPNAIEQLVIQIGDLEELLQMEIKDFYRL